eukprot:11278708-Alexandrium_andersonii.AAC.1
MSASLVGSEMCIRDRLLAPRGTGGRVHQKTLLLWHRRAGSTGGRAGGPVSYTHLTLPTICSV